jgi:hypothetical protein
MTPACNVKINHGNRDAKPAVAIKRGDRVTAEATHGYATPDIPSPKFEMAVAVHKRQYEAPSFLDMKELYCAGFADSDMLSRKPMDKTAKVVAINPPTYIGRRKL